MKMSALSLLPLLLMLAVLLPPSSGQSPSPPASSPPPSPSPPRLVCFYEDWARYRPAIGRFLPSKIPPHLCTHLHYVGAQVTRRLLVGPLDVFADVAQGGYRDAIKLREHNPELKVLTMLGAGSNQQTTLADAAGDADKRKKLVDAAVEFVREYDFDGVDLDWKPPHPPADHAALLEDLRAAFDRDTAATGRRRLLLAVDLTPHPDELREHFDMARVIAAVDYATVLGYRYQLSSDTNLTSHLAPLRTPPGAPDAAAGRDLVTTVDALKKMNVDMGKFNLALPTFGITFTLANASQAGLYVNSTGPGAPGPVTISSGTLATYEICDKTGRRGWKASRPFPSDVGPFAVGGDQMVAYDDERSLRMKVQFVRQAGFGGVSAWTLTQDDFRGYCTGKPFPMHRAIKAAMLGVDESGLSTTPAPPTTPAYDGADIFVCPADGKYPADDCEHYYLCRGDFGPDKFSCKDGETFDEQLKECRPGGKCTPQPRVGPGDFGPTPVPSQPTATAPRPAVVRGRRPY